MMDLQILVDSGCKAVWKLVRQINYWHNYRPSFLFIFLFRFFCLGILFSFVVVWKFSFWCLFCEIFLYQKGWKHTIFCILWLINYFKYTSNRYKDFPLILLIIFVIIYFILIVAVWFCKIYLFLWFFNITILWAFFKMILFLFSLINI